ncbi:MAG: HEPN domain-containing protein [Leptospiraceae bacterium]|nr:HEPN domain-containing protein [Leptospiraceae bacterium]
MEIINFKEQILARLSQAKETLNDSFILVEQGSFRSSINRSYYAMFYSAQALLYLTESKKSKHTGVIEVFDKYFVKEGVFPKHLSKKLHNAFDVRNFTDYHDMANIDEKKTKDILADANEFVIAIEKYFIDSYSIFL